MVRFYHQPKHFSNVTGPHVLPCSHVLSLPYQERCSFIQNTTECHAAVHYFDYLKFIFCTIGGRGEFAFVGGVFLLSILCLYLFTVLATTADKFFCPALAVISKMLKMSENLAGVTLLAFGNGSPDIFASLAGSSGDTELVYTELIGAAIFVTGFIAGLVIFYRPFKVVGRNYIRDVLFFIFASIFISNAIHNQHYTIVEGACTVLIYVAYLACVVFDHFQMKREAQKLRRMSDSDSLDESFDIMRKVDVLEDATEIKIYSRRNSNIISDDEILSVFRREFKGDANAGLLKTFLQSLNPLNKEWRDAGWVARAFIVLKTPVVFLLSLVIPIVDFAHGEELHGWSKALNMLNLIALPQFVLFITGYITTIFFDYVPLSLIVFFISFAVCSVVYHTSRNDCPPKYHIYLFAAGSFIGSVAVIYVVAKEVVSVMKAVGIISDMTDSMVGLLFLALGNSVGDLFSSIALAKQGYQQMAFSSCFGGPMFNSLLGMGFTFIVKALNSNDNLSLAREGALGPNCIIFLVLILFFPLLAQLFTNFHARKSIGIYMIVIYFIFILYAFLGEFEVMHPYGTDHHQT